MEDFFLFLKSSKLYSFAIVLWASKSELSSPGAEDPADDVLFSSAETLRISKSFLRSTVRSSLSRMLAVTSKSSTLVRASEI